MNFLGLAQRAAIECGASSQTAIAVALPTVIGAMGNLQRIIGWVNDAWTDIQMAEDCWDWMRSSNLLGQGVSFQTVSGTFSYPLGAGAGTVGVPVDSFGKWDRESFRNFTTSAGTADEIVMDEIPYDTWRNGYMLGAMRSVRTRPVAVAVGPDQSLCLGPPANSQYTVTADYFVAPSEMVADADVPLGLPTRFHMLIVYGVMRKYGQFESAPEVYQRGKEEGSVMSAQLMAVRAPRITMGGALA